MRNPFSTSKNRGQKGLLGNFNARAKATGDQDMKQQVLIVEDNPLNSELLRDWLEMEGYLAVIAPNLWRWIRALKSSNGCGAARRTAWRRRWLVISGVDGTSSRR